MLSKEELVAKIEAARHTYYNAQPTISDAEYDALESQLQKLDPDHWLLKTVGAPPGDTGWSKVKHAIPMSSLNKAQVQSEMLQWQQGLGTPCTELVLTEKLDGISCAIRIQNGHFTQALTRGDGTIGEDITRNVSLMKGVAKQLTGPFANWNGYIRGEIICLKSDHAKYFPEDANPRNTASGTAKRQTNPEKCKYLTVLVYQVLPDTGNLATKKEELLQAKEMGFTTPHFALCPDMNRVENIYQRYIQTAREKLDYDIDGLVIEVDSNALAESLGQLTGRPKGAVAYKFPHSTAEAVLEDVIWQVGNSGRITPVAIFSVVQLDGAKITRASLHNISHFLQLNLTRGDRIQISRRNMVIPYVEKNLSTP
jgi:DNA ligase (NAD+)